MITINEMKDILFKKLQDEETAFKRSDIHINKTDYGYKIYLNGYEPLSFHMYIDDNDVWKHSIEVTECYKEEFNDSVDLQTDSDDESMRYSLINIGYFVGTRY